MKRNLSRSRNKVAPLPADLQDQVDMQTGLSVLKATDFQEPTNCQCGPSYLHETALKNPTEHRPDSSNREQITLKIILNVLLLLLKYNFPPNLFQLKSLNHI